MKPARVPEGFQGITHLGAPVRVFSPCRAALPMLVIPVLWVAVLGLIWNVGREAPGGFPPKLWALLGVWLVVMGVLGWLGLRRLREWAVVYEEGFARLDAGGLRAWRWEDVRQVVLVPGESSCGHRIETAEGQELSLPGAPDALGKTIRDQTFALRQQRLAQAFEHGEALDFGRFTVSRGQGVRYADQVHAWGDVRSMGLRSGQLVISMKDDSFFHAGGASCALSLIPNPDVLLDLARSLGVEADPEAVHRLP
ncbi:MAG: hypothetical protein FJX75_25895 [Armatimonadetes bacterium]|nr:hypothetical protein [Armatimonadota bacterium]